MTGNPKIAYSWCHWVSNIVDSEWQYCDSDRLMKKGVFVVFSKVFIKSKSLLKFVDGFTEAVSIFIKTHLCIGMNTANVKKWLAAHLILIY